jgi:uncharacterized protein RhaS with RHS repeats
MLDTSQCVWLSRDPIAENGGINLYGYGPNNPVSGIDELGLAWESTQTQGLHYNDRKSNFGFGLGVGSDGELKPVPLGGSHTFDEKKAQGILDDTVRDKKKWKSLREQQARNFDDPSYRDKRKCRRVGRAMRLAGALGGLGLIAGANSSQLDVAARDYVNARTSHDRYAAAAHVVAEAARLGVTDTGGLLIYNALTK